MKRWQSRFNPQCELSRQDLLDISEDITQTHAPRAIHQQSELVIMPVDPVNLYAYWNLEGSEVDENIIRDDRQFALRICSLPELSEYSANIKLRFDVSVQGLQNRQRIQLPAAASAYSAVIGEVTADCGFRALASSDTIHVPREKPTLDVDKETVINSNIHNNKTITCDASRAAHSTITEYIIANREKTLLSKLATDDSIDTENIWYEALTLKNFKGFGYDLKVFENEHNSGSESILLKQVQNKQMSPETTFAIDKSTSGLGLLLSCA